MAFPVCVTPEPRREEVGLIGGLNVSLAPEAAESRTVNIAWIISHHRIRFPVGVLKIPAVKGFHETWHK